MEQSRVNEVSAHVASDIRDRWSEVNRCYMLVGVYLEVGSVFLQVCLNAAAELEDPAPLSLQRCSEGLKRRTLT